MTPTQIEYFLMAARCLNFTEAANKLFITQPALSRQIAAIEEKLDMQLFIRGGKVLQLTPAAEVLLQELPGYMALYQRIIEKAQAQNRGFSGTLRVGMLEGNVLTDPFTHVFHDFTEIYPNIQVLLESFSYTGLISGLEDGSLDIIVSLSFDLDERTDLRSMRLGESETHIVLRKDQLPEGNERPSLYDLRGKNFLCVIPTESGQSAMRTINKCREAGFEPKIKYAPSVTTLMLWVEAGLGVALLHGENVLKENPKIAFIRMDRPQILDVSIAWKKENENVVIPMFLSQFNKID